MKKLLLPAVAIAALALAAAPAAYAHDDDFGAAALGFALGAVLAPPVVYQAPPPAVVYQYAPAPRVYGGWYPAPRVYYYQGDDDWHHEHEGWHRRWHHRWHHEDHRRWRRDH